MRSLLLVTTTAATALLLLASSTARAETIIKNPNDHEAYRFELEPHVDIGLVHYGNQLIGADSGATDFGAGFRASIKLLDPGFIPKLNNTIAITFGVDLTDCPGCAGNVHFYLPVGMQWNFYVLKELSVFGEPGIILRVGGAPNNVYADFLGELGVRYHFSEKLALTGRVGYPFFSVGLSIFTG